MEGPIPNNQINDGGIIVLPRRVDQHHGQPRMALSSVRFVKRRTPFPINVRNVGLRIAASPVANNIRINVRKHRKVQINNKHTHKHHHRNNSHHLNIYRHQISSNYKIPSHRDSSNANDQMIAVSETRLRIRTRMMIFPSRRDGRSLPK